MENELHAALGRVEGKVDLLIDMHKTTEKRLNSVEKKVWWVSGGLAVLGAFIQKKMLGA